MKQVFFEKFSDKQLRMLRIQLNDSFIKVNENLPDEIKTYINKENQSYGNVMTRTNRCITIIDHECVRRFLNQD